MERKSFCQQFKIIVLFCTLAGIYIPGFEVLFPGNPKLWRMIIKFYSMFGIFCMIFSSVDPVLILSPTDNIALNDIFYTFIWFGTYFWIYFVAIYYNCYTKQFKEIICIWETNLISSCITKKIQTAVKKTTSTSTILSQTMVYLIVVPYIIISFYYLSCGQVFAPSYFGYEIENKHKAPLIICFINNMSMIFSISRMVMFQNLGWFILKLVLLENELLLGLVRDTNEQINILPMGKNQREKLEILSSVTRNKLKAIINNHCQLRINKVKEMFAPIYVFEMGIITFFSTCMTLCATSGLMPVHQLLDLLLFLPTFLLLIFTSCRHGQNIKMSSQRLALEVLGGKWMYLPIDIQKMLLMIAEISNQRPTTINYRRLYPLDLETYHSMLSLQYQLYNFLRNVDDK